MGGCLADGKRLRKPQLFKDRQQILNSDDDMSKYQEISQKQCYQTLRRQIEALPGKEVSYQDFNKMFSNLSKYSDQTRKKFFSIFSGNQKYIQKKDLRLGIIIFQQAPRSVVQRTIFYLYADYKHLQLEKRIITKVSFNRFTLQNKDFKNSKQLQAIKRQKQFVQLLLLEEDITFFQFQDYLRKFYSLKKFRSLLQWNLQWKQKQLAEEISKVSPFDFRIDDPVYLIQYQWFLAWKSYMKDRYNCDIEFQRLKNSQMNQHKQMEKSSLRKQQSTISKPKQIKNIVLQGFYSNTLKRGLKQFRDYVFVPQSIWEPLYFIYPGGPAFKRSYPELYSMTVIQVYVNQYGYFKPSTISEAFHYSEDRKGKYRIKQLFLKDKYHTARRNNVSDVVCFIKPEGKLQWTLIKDLQDDLSKFLTRHRTYICFVPKNLKNIFQNQYNCIVEHNKKKIKNRVSNYGSVIQISKSDAQRANVIDIPTKQLVMVDFQDNEGVYQRKLFKIGFLKSLNPQTIEDQQNEQYQIAGLQNLGNTCYANSVIQCLIATPCFGEYLQKQYSKLQEENCIKNEVYQIFDSSRKSKNTIDTSKLKKKIDLCFPFFVGYSQQDAQQFLINLLAKIQEEINFDGKANQESNGQVNENSVNLSAIRISTIGKSSMIDPRLKKRQTIQSASQQDKFRFFSGMTETETICTECKNKGKLQKQYFFTYSLSLPEHHEKQYYFIFVPKLTKKNSNWYPLQYGFTASNKISFQDSVSQISTILNISEDKLFVMPVMNGQWRDQFDKQKELNQFLNFGMKIVCYEVNCNESPDNQQLQSQSWKGKTVKIQVRQRIFESKLKAYTSFYIPFLFEMQQQSEWFDLDKSLTNVLQQQYSKVNFQNKSVVKINDKQQKELEKKQSQNEKQKYKLMSTQINIKKNEVQPQETEKKANSAKNLKQQQNNQDPEEKESQESRIRKYYKLRLIKRDNYTDNSCFICLKKFRISQTNTGSPRKPQQKCLGCIPQSPLIEDLKFINNIKRVTVVIDWEDNINEVIEIKKDESCSICEQKTKKRKDKIKDLLENQYHSKEELELNCSVETCQNNLAQRNERLAKYPNIFILHLKRFRFVEDCFLKLTNSVTYQQKFTINNETYELYGVISHSGSGTGGHYIAFVKKGQKWYKCDDQRVSLAKATEVINPQAYLLFYKKVSFIPSLLKVHF